MKKTNKLPKNACQRRLSFSTNKASLPIPKPKPKTKNSLLTKLKNIVAVENEKMEARLSATIMKTGSDL